MRVDGSWDSLYLYHDGAFSPRILCAQGKVLPLVTRFLRSLFAIHTLRFRFNCAWSLVTLSCLTWVLPLVDVFLAFVTVLRLSCFSWSQARVCHGLPCLGFFLLWAWFLFPSMALGSDEGLLERHVEPHLSLSYLLTGLLRMSTYLLNL